MSATRIITPLTRSGSHARPCWLCCGGVQMLAPPAYQLSAHDHSRVSDCSLGLGSDMSRSLASSFSLRLWRDALYRTAVATAVPCSFTTATKEGRTFCESTIPQRPPSLASVPGPPGWRRRAGL